MGMGICIGMPMGIGIGMDMGIGPAPAPGAGAGAHWTNCVRPSGNEMATVPAGAGNGAAKGAVGVSMGA